MTPKALIVDDASIMRHRLRSILEGPFRVVAEAANGVEALEMYRLHNPDFLTLDISMPEMNGLDALKNILLAFPEAKIIIVSAVGQKQIVFEALAMGAKDFVIKPFEPERVLAAAKHLFQ